MEEDSSPYYRDTIVAQATPAGTGAISLVRISGPDAVALVDRLTDRPITDLHPRTAAFRRLRFGGSTLDETLVTVFRAPFSYTGEDLVEISLHGSPYIVGRVLEVLLREARAAEPGEFTQRTFLNGRIDLAQAEAVGDLIAARTAHAHEAAIGQLEKRLSRRIARILDRLTEYRAQLELEIDFTDQEVETVDPERLSGQLDDLLDELRSLAHSGEEGMILRDGLRVGLAGPPNVGKSSLFNAILSTERAIVTPHPGTTRDYLEEAVSIDGYLVRLFDTAGLRETDDPVERIGLGRTAEILTTCHRVIMVTDGGEASTELPSDIPSERIVRVLNKCDTLSAEILRGFREKGDVVCSAKTGEGLDELKAALVDGIATDGDEVRTGILTNARQIAAAQRAITALEKAVETASIDYGPELLAFDLAQASTALEEIVGRVTADDILHRIFSGFCIGK